MRALSLGEAALLQGDITEQSLRLRIIRCKADGLLQLPAGLLKITEVAQQFS